jgi:hypothetical protein
LWAAFLAAPKTLSIGRMQVEIAAKWRQNTFRYMQQQIEKKPPTKKTSIVSYRIDSRT